MYGDGDDHRQLDRDAWIRAGLDALERGGVEAVAVVPLARELGVTRGSFYWHFASRDELLAAVLERWEREHSDAVLDALGAHRRPARAPARAARARASKPPSYFVRLLDAAGPEPLVARDARALAPARPPTLAAACRQAGMTPAEARHHALLCYAAYVGLARLGATPRRPRRASARRSPGTWPRRSCPRGRPSLRCAPVPVASTEQTLAERLLAGDRRALARAITLVEYDDPRGWDARPRGLPAHRQAPRSSASPGRPAPASRR